MSLRRFLPTLLTIILITFATSPALARDRDPLAPVFTMEAPPFEAFPPELISEPNHEAITALVNEARQFGVPVAVRVVSQAQGHENLPRLDEVDPSGRIPEEMMRELAREWMSDEPIESSPGAADGFLMLVVMPDDPTLSSAVIEAGPNALPLNGLTQDSIDEVVETLVLPSFENNEISQGIRTGLSVFSYNNLFGTPERLQLDELHQDLQLVAGVPLAGATTLAAVGLLALAWWISRRTPPAPVEPPEGRLTPFAAGALAEGRVSDAVVTSGVLELLHLGALRRDEGHPGRFSIDETRASEVSDPFLAALLHALRRNADAEGRIRDAAMNQLPEITGPARADLENDLAARGMLNKDARVETMWLILASMLAGGIALFALLPSILGMARFGIAAITLAAIAIAGVLIWAAKRSWTTPRGREALAEWEQAASNEERAIYDTIVHQDDLVSAVGGPFTPPAVDLVRSLRGLGAT